MQHPFKWPIKDIGKNSSVCGKTINKFDQHMLSNMDIWTRTDEFIKEHQINLGSPRRGKAAGCHSMDANTAKRKVLSLSHLRRHENLS